MRTTQRLDKVLSNMGYGTRKEVKQLVQKGCVSVDGAIIYDSAFHVDPEKSTIEVNGTVVVYKKYIYIMMNKPANIITATWDAHMETVIDILPEKYKHYKPFPVGRLDVDTVGLLLLTNDGKLAHQLTSPRYRIPKKYYAVIEGRVSESDVEMFSKGLVLDDGYKTLPSELSILKTGRISEVEITIYEGKYHQIKRMFEAVGKKVKYLKRIEMGKLTLDETLREGETRELTEDEINSLQLGNNH